MKYSLKVNLKLVNFKESIRHPGRASQETIVARYRALHVSVGLKDNCRWAKIASLFSMQATRARMHLVTYYLLPFPFPHYLSQI